jgi:steroid 5-alpha reductase family enzyme
MTVMLLRVSGVPLLEKTLMTTKPGYQETDRGLVHPPDA